MAKKSMTVEVKIEYDFIIFDGTNFDAVRDFVDTYNLYGNSDIVESFHKRPDDIPNLDEDELLQWWESTGEEVITFDRRAQEEVKYSTHNRTNMPLWRKDELLMIDFKCSQNGFVARKWLHKNDAIILVGRNHYILHNANEKEVMDFIENPYR